ncbi:MAG: hypothetical protein OEW40_05515, partial [Cyclobacteriaceae bacterium]|nr:hypothetical protein [Cyclobacteriaceae bacterium]
MKIIKATGLLLFVFGFIVFNISFFQASYTLTPELVKEKISEPAKTALFLQKAESILNQNIPSNFAFVAKVKAAFYSANDQQIKQYSITTAEVNLLVSLHREKFSIATVDSVFSSKDAISVFKNQALKTYGSWLDGQPFDSQEELKAQILG